MQQQHREREVKCLMALCTLVYFASYVTRSSYAAVMVEILAENGFSYTDGSAALTVLFITYGAGQLLSGYLGDRFRPFWLIFLGLIVCASMNVLIPFCTTAAQMAVVWSVNGLAQAMMWPPMAKIIAVRLSDEDYQWATVRVSWGGSAGTIFVYLLVPFTIRLANWQSAFFVCALLAALVALLWFLQK